MGYRVSVFLSKLALLANKLTNKYKKQLLKHSPTLRQAQGPPTLKALTLKAPTDLNAQMGLYALPPHLTPITTSKGRGYAHAPTCTPYYRLQEGGKSRDTSDETPIFAISLEIY